MAHTSQPIRVYLAGPDVFHPQARQLGDEKKSICAALGLMGVFPLDETVSGNGMTPAEHGIAISAKDARLARSCDAVLVNLTPYLGPSMDVGTAVELGLMVGLGKPAFGYTNKASDFAGRVADFGAPVGWKTENFGLTDNLMVDGMINASGGRVIVPERDLPFEDMTTFTDAATALAKHLGENDRAE